MENTQRKWSRIIGLDLSKQTFKGCILSGESFTDKEMFDGRMSQDSGGYGLIRARIRDGDIVLMEAGSSTFNLARYLIRESSAAQIVVLNPANLRIIWDSMRKTDKSDAVKIACIARDMRPEAWPTVPVPSAQEQAERSVITQHVFLRKQETQLFNRLFALYNSLGYPDIDKARLKEDSGYRMELADKLLSVSELSLLNGMMLNDQINLVQLQLKNHEERLRRICLAHPRQALSWLSIPGIGLVNAATLIAYVGDGARYSKADQLLNYAGLVPKLNQSGTVDIHGRITKRGCSAIRRNVVQGAHVLMKMRVQCPLTRFAYRKRQQCPFNGKVAVAVATHMLRTGLAMLHKDNALYVTAAEDNYEKLRRKLAEYKVKALAAHLPK